MKRLISLVGSLGIVALLMASPVRAIDSNQGSFTTIFSGYTGTPSPTTTFPSSNAAFPGDVIKTGGLGQKSIQVSASGGADGVGTVQLWSRTCPTTSTLCGWYIEASCESPPDRTVATTRCNFLLADDLFYVVAVTAYTSGTFQAIYRQGPTTD